ncbi:MAG: hypothetical protein WCL38_03705, partial [Actinomycetota bacterium]
MSPDLLRINLDLNGLCGTDLPIEVSAVDSFSSPLEPAERRLNVVARRPVSLTKILKGDELLCDVFDRCAQVSRFLREYAEQWLG